MASVFIVGASGYIGLGIATAFRRAGMSLNNNISYKLDYLRIFWWFLD
jgi:N-acetyl-gamma-glutamylphosphate reductase